MLFKALAIAASQLIQANLGGETVLAGKTSYFAIQSDLEMTNIRARHVTKVREAGVFDLAFLRISTNTLSGSVVYTLQKNGIDQPLTITIDPGTTGPFHDETQSFHASAGDEIGWKVVSARGTGSLKQTMAGLRFSPDNPENTVTFLSAFSAGSFAVKIAGTTLYLVPNGTRGGQAKEALAQQRIQEAATWRGLYTVQGTNRRTADTIIGFRKNGADEGAQVTIPALNNAIRENAIGSVTLEPGDDFNYVLRTTPEGSGTYNLERINSELVSTNGKFFFFTARPGGVGFTAARFIPLAGELTSSATESEAEFVVRFPFRLEKMIAKVVSNTGKVDGAVLRVRKNGINELLELAIDRQKGILSDNGEVVELEAGDRVCFQFDNPSGNVKIQYIGIVGDDDTAPNNRPPLANAGPDQTALVSERLMLDGSGSTDPDGDVLSFAWSFVSRPAGSLALLSDPAAVTPTFDIDVPGTYIVQLIVNDGTVASSPDTVTIDTANSRPVADAGPDQTVSVNDSVVLDGSGSTDVDGDRLSFAWSFVVRPPGSSAVLTNPTDVVSGFDVDLPGTYVVQLIVNDGTLDSTPDTVVIDTRNSIPVADAGPDQTALVSERVVLDGSGSTDPDGDVLSFAWSFVSRPAGSLALLSDPVAVTPTFDIDVPGTYIVQLIVNDGTVVSSPDTVTIDTANSRPVADAGPDQTVSVNDSVVLDGSGSTDVDGDRLSFAWSFVVRPPGSSAVLTNPTDVVSGFDVDLPGTYVVQLIVNDGTVDSTPDTVVIDTGNSIPVADAGPDQTVFVTNTVNLDGSGSSDADGDVLSFAWSFVSRPAGSLALLSDPAAVTPTFDIDVPGTYIVQLIVNDGTVASSPDTVTIDTANSRPVADAGPDQTVSVNDSVVLNGSGSTDVDGDRLSFAWSFVVRPPGSGAVLTNPTDVVSGFDVDLPGTYVVQLIVNDGTVDSTPDTVVIDTGNSIPVADAGPDQTVFVSERVVLDGSGSTDPDGSVRRYPGYDLVAQALVERDWGGGTVNATGAVYRLLTDFSGLDRSLAIIALGQSGQPESAPPTRASRNDFPDARQIFIAS